METIEAKISRYLYFIENIDKGISRDMIEQIESDLGFNIISNVLNINTFSKQISLVNYNETVNILKDKLIKIRNREFNENPKQTFKDLISYIKNVLTPLEELTTKELKKIPKVIYDDKNNMLITDTLTVDDFLNYYKDIISSDTKLKDNLNLLDLFNKDSILGIKGVDSLSSIDSDNFYIELEKTYIKIIKSIINSKKCLDNEDIINNKLTSLIDFYNSERLTIGMIRIIDAFKEELIAIIKDLDNINFFNVFNNEILTYILYNKDKHEDSENNEIDIESYKLITKKILLFFK